MSRATEMHGFLPDDYVELRMQRRTNILWALIFLIVAGGIGSAYFIAQNKIRNAEQVNKEVSDAFIGAKQAIEQFQNMQTEQQRLNQKAELVGSLIERVNRSNILAELTNARPPGVYLNDFDLVAKIQSDPNVAKMAIDRAKAAGAPKPILYTVSLRVSAYAAKDIQASQYVTNLQRSPLFASVDFVDSKEVTYREAKVRLFTLEITLDPAADSRALAVTKTTSAGESR